MKSILDNEKRLLAEKEYLMQNGDHLFFHPPERVYELHRSPVVIFNEDILADSSSPVSEEEAEPLPEITYSALENTIKEIEEIGASETSNLQEKVINYIEEVEDKFLRAGKFVEASTVHNMKRDIIGERRHSISVEISNT